MTQHRAVLQGRQRGRPAHADTPEHRGEEYRGCPGRAVDDLDRDSATVGEPQGVDGFCTVLGDRAIDTANEGGDITTGSTDELRVPSHGRGDLGLGPGGRSGQSTEGLSQAGQGHGVDRGTTTVDRDSGRHRTREVAHRFDDSHLQRVVDVAVTGQVPAVGNAGGEHRGVLARAVRRDGLFREPAGDPGDPSRLVVGKVGRVLQVGLAQTRPREDLPRGRDMEVLARVAGARESEEGTVRGETVPHHGERLQWLARRAREDGAGGVADLEQHGAVGAGDDGTPSVH